MVTGDLKYGFGRERGVIREDMFIGDEWETYELGRGGVGAFVGGMPSPLSKFTLGARLRVETLVMKDGVIPLLSGAASAGVTLGEPRKRQFGFVLAGVGAEGIPALTPAIFAAHLLGGTSVDGVVLAAGVDVGLMREFSYFLFGVEIGWSTCSRALPRQRAKSRLRTRRGGSRRRILVRPCSPRSPQRPKPPGGSGRR